MYVFCLRVWSTFTTAECPTVAWSPVTVWWTAVLSWRSQTTATTRFWRLRDALVTTHLKKVREPIGWWTGVTFCFSWCGLFVWVATTAANQCSSMCCVPELLWTAPEILRIPGHPGLYGTLPGDVYSFAIVMQEVVIRGPPFCMMDMSAAGKITTPQQNSHKPENAGWQTWTLDVFLINIDSKYCFLLHFLAN